MRAIGAQEGALGNGGGVTSRAFGGERESIGVRVTWLPRNGSPEEPVPLEEGTREEFFPDLGPLGGLPFLLTQRGFVVCWEGGSCKVWIG